MAVTSACFDGFQPKLGHRCNIWTHIYWWGQRSHIKVKGYLRSRFKIGWKCESSLIYKVEVQLEPNLSLLIHYGTLCVLIQSEVIYQGQRSSEIKARLAENEQFKSFEKFKAQSKPNLAYIDRTFTCLWRQRWGQFVR